MVRSAAATLEVPKTLAVKVGVLKLARKTGDVMPGRSRSRRPESGSKCPACQPSFVERLLAACVYRLSTTDGCIEDGTILEQESPFWTL
jgi:hypothetical protein